MLVDTNILIAYLNNEKSVVQQLTDWKAGGIYFYISTINLAEILSYTKWSDRRRKKIISFMEKEFCIIPFDAKISIETGIIRSKTKIKLPDAGIAATASHLHIPIVTRNLKDFNKLHNIQIIFI